MSILRTRPETNHLWSIVERLDRYTDHVLGVGMGSLGGTLDEILPEVEKVLIRERPEAVRSPILRRPIFSAGTLESVDLWPQNGHPLSYSGSPKKG